MLHTMAQRSSGAGTRARSRWQPYNSTLIASTSRPPAPYLNTPVSAISTSPPHSTHPSIRHIHLPPDVIQRKPRQAASLIGKHPHAGCLIFHPARVPDGIALPCVDHAVRSLSEIWQDDYLSVYTTTKVATQPPNASGSQGSQECAWRTWNPAIQRRVQQLPSPVSPSTVETPPLSPLAPALHGLTGPFLSGKPGVAPLQGFVQELIRRSRTSGSVLQTALCYIEAVRRKLPEMVSAPAAPVKDTSPEEYSQDREVTSTEPLIPSPLLCPRRTFLASLILASKFLQDRCYSNRAWAKLSGLSPREVGRCEKALGDALEWRLWVGKQSGKPLARSRSHADLSFGTANLCGASSKIIGRSRTFPSIGTECSNVRISPVALSQPKLDPYQEWLILNQSRLEAEEEEEEEPTPMAVKRMSVAPVSDILTPSTPSLVQSPASSIFSAASIASFDSDDSDRTIQVTDISEPLPPKFSGNLDAWFDSAAPVPGVAVRGAYSAKAFEYVDLANPYPLE